jgi:deaminated glutathione amidase
MKKKFRAALVQMKSSLYKEQNLAYSLKLIKEAAQDKAQLICFPEFQMAYSPPEQKQKNYTKLQKRLMVTSYQCYQILPKKIK